jgi:hypothetical protein
VSVNELEAFRLQIAAWCRRKCTTLGKLKAAPDDVAQLFGPIEGTGSCKCVLVNVDELLSEREAAIPSQRSVKENTNVDLQKGVNLVTVEKALFRSSAGCRAQHQLCD